MISCRCDFCEDHTQCAENALPCPEQLEDGDFVISSCGPLGSDTRVSIIGGGSVTFIGEEQDEEARAYIKDRMERDNFYPTVWMESDHGNLEAINVWEEQG